MIEFGNLLIIILLLGGSVGFIIYYFTSQIKSLKTDLTKDDDQYMLEWLKEMKSSVEKNTDTLHQQLKEQRDTLENQLKHQRSSIQEQTKLIWDRLDSSSKVIQGVQNQLGGIQAFGKNIQDLSNVLRSPKLRGGLGEQMLYEILGVYLPKQLFTTQYKFKDGNVCDAVVFTDKGLIPIDSKFSAENFKLMIETEDELAKDKIKKLFWSDLKKRIDEISSKYILPDQKTTDQAIMYIPSENVYYEIIVNAPDIEEYAKRKNVMLASPNTLIPFLKIIMIGHQQQELNKHAGEILKLLGGLKIEMGKFGGDIGILERHITNAYKTMDTVRGKYAKLTDRIENIQVITPEDEKILLEPESA